MDTMKRLDAKQVGGKSAKGTAIITEMFFEEEHQLLDSEAYGVIIPHEQIEKRTKLNWVCYLEKTELMKMDNNFGNYLNH